MTRNLSLKVDVPRESSQTKLTYDINEICKK